MDGKENLNMESVNTQMLERAHIKTKVGTVVVVDVLPTDYQEEPPIFYIPGWAESIDSSRKIISSLVEKGFRVIAADFDYVDKKTEDAHGYPEIEYRRTLAILEVLSTKQIKKAHLIGHSEGAINAIIFANLSPNFVSTVTLAFPGGIVKHQDLRPVVARYIMYLVSQFDVRSWHEFVFAFVYLKEVLKFCIFNPIQAFEQAVGMNEVNSVELIERLKKKNTPVYIIHGSRDNIAPRDVLQEELSKICFSDTHLLEGGHNHINTHPDEFVSLFKKIIKV